MDATKSIDKANPRESANTVSVLVWWWTIRLFKEGYSKVLGPDDLYQPLKDDKSSKLGDRLENRWMSELENAKRQNREPSFLKAIFFTFSTEYFLLGLIQLINEFALSLGTPLLLGGLLKYFKSEPTTTYEMALWYAGGISLANAIEMITVNQAMFGSLHVGGRIRIAVCSVVYRKALRLSKTALGETAPGKIVNLVANDVNRFDLVSTFLHHMWSAPLLSLTVAVILYYQAGYAGLAGIVAIFLVVPIQAYAGKLSSKFRLQTALKTDERVRFMDEIISGVQVIKMYAWEKPFCSLIELARKLELRVVRKSSYIRGIYMTFNLFTTRMALYCTLLALVYSGESLTADKVFVFSSFFSILSHTMTGMFVRGFAEIAECMVAVRRLQTFLTYEEFLTGNVTNNIMNLVEKEFGDSHLGDRETKSSRKNVSYDNIEMDVNCLRSVDELNIIINKNHTMNNEQWAVKFDEVTAKWNVASSETTLEDISLEVERGKLYILIGLVGSGKSSFLSTILGELNILQGNVEANGTLSYADQDAWVFGATVRQNILFGQTFDQQRYQRVVRACALLKDFQQFPQGDRTIVGERGSSLSGGQKARVNLARAVYRQADIYLLDDPLSAVDAHVGKHLFEECIKKYLRGKTRILATHQLQYMKGADSIFLLDQGKIHEYKDYHDLLRSYPEYNSLIAEEKNDVNGETCTENNLIKRQLSTAPSTRSRTSSSGDANDDEDRKDSPKNFSGLIESTSKGVIEGSILWKYLRIGASLPFTCVLLLLFVATQLMVSVNDYYTNIFVTAEESRAYYKELEEGKINSTFTIKNPKLLDKEDIQSVDFYVSIYSAIVVGIFLIAITRSFAFYSVCLNASQRLHDYVFGAIIRASMRFFDTNSSGRILNRFSKDMLVIDEQLPKAMLDAGQVILLVTGTIVVSCIVNPYFIVLIVGIGTIFYWMRKAYLKTSKNIKRLEGMTRSPVFTHLNATLNGLSTIRAYGAQKILEKEFDNLQDVHTASWYMFIVTSTAFGFSLDFFCFFFISAVIFSFLLIQANYSGGEVGLAVTQVMSLAGTIQWGMRQATEVANHMMAVERVLEYTQVPPEPNLRDKGVVAKITKSKAQEDTFVDPPKDWPSQGLINFKHAYMSYTDEDPPVLKDLNLVIEPSEKVGIVGRTGAGKSSLISALFRIARVKGVIEIDGVDTGTVALEDLRKFISIIPQLPVLFSGTLRRNLDPFGEFSDKQLWQVLEEVELKDAATATGHGLDNRVLDRGANYSVGQRQLICLARAILRNNKVLMLDEATANVDPQTDALIQRTIRTKFAKCTVLTVAHRLNTIMDSDKVLVMDRGQLVEFDHPHVLLQNELGEFTSLVKETGRAMFEQLCEVAREAYINKYFDTHM